jgi:hypothetical protein
MLVNMHMLCMCLVLRMDRCACLVAGRYLWLEWRSILTEWKWEMQMKDLLAGEMEPLNGRGNNNR